MQNNFNSNERDSDTITSMRPKNSGSYNSVAGRIALIAKKPGKGPRGPQRLLSWDSESNKTALIGAIATPGADELQNTAGIDQNQT